MYYCRPVNKQRGQGLLEFALVIPVLLLVLLGAADMGQAYYAYTQVTNAAREGARYGANHPNLLGNVPQKACQELGYLSCPSSVSVTYSCPSGNCSGGAALTVVVTLQYQFASQGLLPTLTIMNQATMPVLGNPQ